VSVGSPHGNPSLFVDKSNGIPTSFMGHPVPCGQVQWDPHLLHGTPSSLWTSPRGSPPPSWDTQFLVDKSKGIPTSFMGHPAPCGQVQKGFPPHTGTPMYLWVVLMGIPVSLWTCPMGITTSFMGHPVPCGQVQQGSKPHTGTPNKSNGDPHLHGTPCQEKTYICHQINKK
jgi:hypothetical protein